MSLFNERVFDNKLKGVPDFWNTRLTSTAGYCRQRKIGTVRKSHIDLSDKLLTSAERVWDTLIHELCHAAAWILDGEATGHGKIWKYWTERSNKRLPELPKMERCHHYDVPYKYTYKCTFCGLKSQARSKSKKVENIRCSACHGPIEVFLNKKEKDETITLVSPKEPSIFAKFVKENYELSKLTAQEKLKYK